MQIKQKQNCGICLSTSLKRVREFPKLPLSDTYTTLEDQSVPPEIDLNLLYCDCCGHVQLGDLIDPITLYGSNYHFRTGESAVARAGTQFHINFLERNSRNHTFNHALDIGCNDLHLLKCIENKVIARTGIDPLLPPGKALQEGIQTIGGIFENLNLVKSLDTPPDLVVCRHTLEHIWEPRIVLETMMDVATNDALFLIEIPSLDVLLDRFRIDQIFHQHLQYFSLTSLTRLIEEVGGYLVDYEYNYHDWGALVVAFRRGRKSHCKISHFFSTDEAKIDSTFKVFETKMAASQKTIRALSGTIYGYGAAQMLPVIAYHLKTDLSELKAILDDDPQKDGLTYSNLPVKIMAPHKANDFDESSVLLTAVDNASPILKQLLYKRPRRIIYPMNII
ncbi:methyltransferase domain-containing protein [Opitutales bacterium]|nr:methyltransferase domain-containing protein [Opitutales bacterium]